MSKIVGRKVKIVGAPTPDRWPLSGVLLGKRGKLSRVFKDKSVPHVGVIISSPAHVGEVSFFPEELRYLNNRKVVLDE